MIRSIFVCTAAALTALACGDDATASSGARASSQTNTADGDGSVSAGATA